MLIWLCLLLLQWFNSAQLEKLQQFTLLQSVVIFSGDSVETIWMETCSLSTGLHIRSQSHSQSTMFLFETVTSSLCFRVFTESLPPVG